MHLFFNYRSNSGFAKKHRSSNDRNFSIRCTRNSKRIMGHEVLGLTNYSLSLVSYFKFVPQFCTQVKCMDHSYCLKLKFEIKF